MSRKTILAIESSCDETALCLIEGSGIREFTIRAECIASQNSIHELYGGVVPELASREHLRNLPILLQAVLRNSGMSLSDLSTIAVTQGPGLKGCLMTGMNFAIGLSAALSIPLVGAHHIEGHVLSALMDNEWLEFPFLCLVVSGGHTELYHVTDVGRYALLARTIDDAAGEAFDKSASLLGFEYPGGAKLAALADSVQGTRFSFPRPMLKSSGLSYSGLKTAISQEVRRLGEQVQSPAIRAELAFAIQESIIEQLVRKTHEYSAQLQIETIAVVGGVAANQRLRATFQAHFSQVAFPEPRHATDNAGMIAYSALLRGCLGRPLPFPGCAKARWPLETLEDAE